MQRWLSVILAFALGAVVGILANAKFDSDEKTASLAGRIERLETRTEAKVQATDGQVKALVERMATLEGRVTAVADVAAAAAVAKPSPVAAATPPSRRAAIGRARDVAIGNAPVRGPADAAVTIVEFSDFQCPFCSRAHPTLERLLKDYPKSVRLAFKHFPLPFHREAPLAHRASIAAGKQGRFWEMHDKLFNDSRNLGRAKLLDHAKALELDMSSFTASLDSEEAEQQLQGDIAQGQQMGVTGTPTFYINGRVISGAQPYENFRALVERELAAKRS